MPDAFRDFVEAIVAKAQAAAAMDNPGVNGDVVDWDSIWNAGDGAPSVELALGRIVAAAFVAAGEISRQAERTFAPDEAIQPLPSMSEVEVPSSTHRTPREDDGQPAVVDAIAPIAPWAESIGAETDQLADEDSLPSDPPRHRSPRSSGWFTFFTWMRNVAAVVILFVAWQLWGTSISQHHEQHQLQNAFDASVHAHKAKPVAPQDGPELISAEKSIAPPPEGSVVAQLQIPSIDLTEYVVSGTAEGDLAKGPGHYIGSAAPGQAGNVAIAGHRTTNGAPFNRLGQIAIKDQIYLTTTSGERFTYVVSEAPRPVSPSDVEVLDNFGDNRITLTTCNPEFSSSQRLIVVGELKGPAPPVKLASKPKAYDIVNAKTASWDWALLPVVGLEAGVLLLLGLSNRRFSFWYGGVARWLILAPLWGAGLYLLFSTLTKFTPATV